MKVPGPVGTVTTCTAAPVRHGGVGSTPPGSTAVRMAVSSREASATRLVTVPAVQVASVARNTPEPPTAMSSASPLIALNSVVPSAARSPLVVPLAAATPVAPPGNSPVTSAESAASTSTTWRGPVLLSVTFRWVSCASTGALAAVPAWRVIVRLKCVRGSAVRWSTVARSVSPQTPALRACRMSAGVPAAAICPMVTRAAAGAPAAQRTTRADAPPFRKNCCSA